MTVPDRPSPLWHAIDADAALAALAARAEGLDEAEAKARLARHGANLLPRPARAGWGGILVRQFKSPLIALLLAAALVSLAIGDAGDAGFIAVVLLANAVIGAVQERRAEGSVAALDSLLHPVVEVRRGGQRRQIPAEDLVPGDVALLESGQRVPADLRLLTATEIRVDESLLTGESKPAAKDPAAQIAAAAPPGDRATILFAGSTLLHGRAEGLVVATGSTSQLGRIAGAMASAADAPPPLIGRLDRLSRWIGWSVMGAIGVIGGLLLATGMPAADVFFLAVALAVSAIPEGLPVAVTVTLSVATARMARRQVIVRSLPAVEGLGACTMIASDKTGTLTCNALTLTRLWLPGLGLAEVTGTGYAPAGELRQDGQGPSPDLTAAARALALAGAACNEGRLEQGPDGAWQPIGDTVDAAFLALAGKLDLPPPPARLELLPFEPARRFAASLNQDAGGKPVLSVKGAAETVLPMCDDIDKAALQAAAEGLAQEGFRVIALASGPGPLGRAEGLTFLGFAGLIDPVRPEVPDAVARCREAGITVCMVTGDHPATALSIARGLGMTERRDQVVTGAELAALAGDPAAYDAKVAGARVFARVEPVQKLDIVQSLQRGGAIVAVTGDGVNDGPALRTADIGVAMGQSGTDVARGAADLVLADDNFASIVAGIEEGRLAYANVRKVIYLLLSTCAAELMLFGFCLAWGLPAPLLAVQLLWLNLATEGIQHVALAFEKAEPGLLDQPPRKPSEALLDRRMIEQILVSGLLMAATGFLLFRHGLANGHSEAEMRSALVLLMVAYENAQLFNCRSETRSLFRLSFLANPLVPLAAAGALGLQVVAMSWGPLAGILRLRPATMDLWLTVLPAGLALVLAMEVYKAVRRRWPGAR